MKTQEQGLTRLRKTQVHLSELQTRPDQFQHRENETEEHHINDLVDAIKQHGAIDPIEVWCHPDEGTLIVLDGHHRRAAYRRVKWRKKVPVIIYEGPEKDARLHALKENAKSRLPMTNTEKTNAAWRLVCERADDEGHLYSKREIVQHTGVADGTVSNMRRTRKYLEQVDIPLPVTWWQAQMKRKGQVQEPLTEDEHEALIEERARRLDDKVGKEIGAVADIQLEAVIKMLEKRLGQKTKWLADWWREDPFDVGDEDESPF
jgi:ParB/RepB/Spo0J family partition protein